MTSRSERRDSDEAQGTGHPAAGHRPPDGGKLQAGPGGDRLPAKGAAPAAGRKNGELLILHLCDALERIEHRETLPALGQSVYEEVTREPNLERAVSICRDIQEMIPELQASEAEYIIMHVGAMLGNMKN